MLFNDTGTQTVPTCHRATDTGPGHGNASAAAREDSAGLFSDPPREPGTVPHVFKKKKNEKTEAQRGLKLCSRFIIEKCQGQALSPGWPVLGSELGTTLLSPPSLGAPGVSVLPSPPPPPPLPSPFQLCTGWHHSIHINYLLI